MKKSSIILALLTLTAALATLPAMGDLNFLKRDYTYLEKIPIGSISSYTNNTKRETSNLIDNDKNTEWISWKENIIWEEPYNHERYFTNTVIDGANATTSTISNNALIVPQKSAAWRQYQVLATNDYSAQLQNLKAGNYTVTMRYRGDVEAPDGGKVFLGRPKTSTDGENTMEYQQSIGAVTTEWQTKTFPYELENDVDNAFCAIQPGTYNGTLEVDWAVLSYVSPYPKLSVISEMTPDNYTIGGPYDFLTFENGCINTYKTNDWYQFRLTDYFSLVSGNHYRAKLQIQGTEPGELFLWCGPFHGTKFNIPTTELSEVIIDFNVCPSDIGGTYMAIQTCDLDNGGGGYTRYDGKIIVKQVILEHEVENGNWVADKTINYKDLQNWPYNRKGNDYIPSLVTENGQTVAKITNPKIIKEDGNYADYAFRLTEDMFLPKGNYTLKAKISNVTNSGQQIHLMIGTEAMNVDKNNHFTLDPNKSDEYVWSGISLERETDYWIVCQPIGGYDTHKGNYTGDFTIESVELIPEGNVQESFSIRNDGNDYDSEWPVGHTSIYVDTETEPNNSIIRSYPLPTTRKVIVATGDAEHASQQGNKQGFNLESGHIYTVSYKIRSANGGTVTTLLANAPNDNWNTANAIGKTEPLELKPDVTESIYTKITTTGGAYNNTGAVVLDLGYNLGQVEVTDLMIVDNYDPTITQHNANTYTVRTENGESEEYRNTFITQQFYAGQNIKFDPTTRDYKLKVDLYGSESGQICAKMGSFYSGSNRFSQYIAFDEKNWVELTFDQPESPFSTNITGAVTLQLVGNGRYDKYNGILNIRRIMLYSSEKDKDGWVDGTSIPWEIPNFTSFPYYVLGNCTPIIENSTLIANPTPGEFYQFMVMDNYQLEAGRNYKLVVDVRGAKVPENATNLSNNVEVSIGNWDKNLSTSFNFTEDWNTYTVQLPPCPTDKCFVIFKPKNNGQIEIKNLKLVPNDNERVELFADYTGTTHPDPVSTGISIDGDQTFYDVSKYTEFTGANGLQLNPAGWPVDVLDNITFELNKVYNVEFDLKVETAGRYVVSLDNGTDKQDKIITLSQSQVGHYVPIKETFNSALDGVGKVTITPLVKTNTIQVSNRSLTYTTPAFDGGDQIGTDFFDVQLGNNYALDQEGKYLFHIGYQTSGTGLAESTPKKFLICGSNDGNNFDKKLGTYEVGEWNDGNAFISTVDNPLKNITDGIRFLRFYCLENEGGETAICFPKEYGNYTQDKAYVGNMMRMTRFGIYKQSTMFATDKANIGYGHDEATLDNYDKWALPVITRFQIEALGKRYAYPGATLHDMIGVKKSTDVSGELFDDDYRGHQYTRTTYWDTTLPFLKDKNRGDDAQDINQYIDYSTFTYPADDEGKTNYDCIDLLLPDMKDLGAVKKYNGRITEDTDAKGYYQVVVSMKRSTGTVDAYNNRMLYPDETTEFKNRSYGFPMEISYQGFTIGDDNKKSIHRLNDTEKVITFPTVAAGDSIHFALKVEEGWDGVRIFCRENTGNLQRRPGGTKKTNEDVTKENDNVRVVDVTYNPLADGVDLSATRIMRLGEIRAYIELNKIDLETKEGRERYDLLYNNRENFNTRTWTHTQGIIANINNLNTVNGSKEENYGQYMTTDGAGGHTWKDVMDTYKDFFDAQGLAYPDFSFINNPFEDEDVVPSNGNKRDLSAYDGKKRQRTYTVLHEVLALPGERVDLYPQSDIWQPEGYNYEEQFVRWYDYLEDNAPDYLFFFAEPKSVIKTQDAGFIGGKTLLDHGLRGKGTVASIYYNDAERLAFAQKVKDNPDFISDRYYLDDSYPDKDGNPVVRIKDNWVAADFSLAFNTNLAERLGKDVKTWMNTGSTIQEPIINFRHIFHITSGSLFADRYMSTAEGNQHYAKSNRRYISTFVNKTFKIRLEQAMPADENTKSPFYYKTEDGQYKRVRGYDIRTYKLGDEQSSDDLVAIINNPEDQGGDTGMFVMDKSSTFKHVDSYVQTTTDRSRWLRNSKDFARSLVCEREKTTKKGRYLVRIYGKDEYNNVIRLKDEDNTTKPLVIAEYEVEFMGNEYASFMPEEKIDELDKGEGDRTLAHHTEKYLEEHYGNGKSDVKAVDFDKYMILNSDKVIVDKGSKPVNFKRFGFFENSRPWFYGSDKTATIVQYQLNDTVSRMKMPIRWSDSNYGFGYQVSGDYNMFRLASHSLMTPYMSAASTRGVEVTTVDGEEKHTMVGETLKWVDDEGKEHEKTGVQGTYDRLYYNTHGEQQGLFYYVNAAADPGEMVKIDFDYLCPGSTIYVSAWVNEFNHGQDETANVIFNFYANVAKDENGEKTILRQEQIHGFSTGYVNRSPDGFDETSANRGGDQGKWMHVYYTFVPEESHADLVKADGEYIDSYYLVLENNCLRSNGADYAVDDIRAYVIAPRVDARQSNSLCEKNDVKVDIEVELPLEALEKSLADLVEDDGKVTLQYSIVDKVVYDDVLKEKKIAFDKTQEDKEKKEEYKPTAEDLREAFVAGVLHYKHTNILSDEHKDADGNSKVDYPLSWGEIEFYMNYKDKDDDDVIPVSINGQTNMTVGEYKEKYIKDIYEKCFVFVTHPVTEDEDGNANYNEFVNTHREYYVVVGNFNTKGIFVSSISDDEKDKYNADVYPQLPAGATAKPDDWGDKWKKYDEDLAIEYQIGTECARMAEFKLKGSAQIVVDGVLHETDDNITCCENQRPVVQINLKTKEKNKENPDLAVLNEAPESENPYLDWWVGPYEEFANMDTVINGKKYNLWDVLDNFRLAYPKAESWNMPTADEQAKVKNLEGEDIDNPYTVDMRIWLKNLCATTKVDETTKETVHVEPKLVLHQSSFVFPQSKTILVDDKGKKVSSKEIFVTAIPPATPTLIKGDDGKDYVICTQPREVKIAVSNTSPTLFNGFSEITYPAEIEDVPLRIGINQLDKVNTGETGNKLFVPLRNVNPATYDVTEFLSFGTEIYLVETNDPNYRRLSDNDKLDPKDPTDTYNVETRVVGKVANLFVKFKKEEDVVTVEGTPMAQVVFDTWKQGTDEKGKKLDQGIIFREGYYYKFKFNFREGETKMEGQEGYEMPCNGQTVFSIKVVPEYQVWTGDSSLNWNNDDNWRRVSGAELLSDSDTPHGIKEGLSQGETDSRFTVNVSHPNTHSYAPLNFTKVIIPAGATYPQLAPIKHSYDQDDSKAEVRVSNGKLPDNPYTWTSTAPDAIPVANMTDATNYNTGDHKEESNTQPTVYINYDMAAVLYTKHGINDNNIYCRPWYANACEQIHFDSNAEILNQQNLDYEKAWVDMEMTPHRWYNVASPLYGVVAGDMYLPSVGTDTPGRQMTELFAPITYNNEDKNQNDRFAPAVYQRGWDKGNETVYILHNDAKDETETVALASTWSHVYNDVTEEYAPGMGYSVKTDVTRLDNFKEDAPADVKQSLVMFRFPKADEDYNYFSDSIQNAGEKNHRDLTRDKAGRLYGFETPKDKDGNVIADKSAGDVILKKANNDAAASKGKLFLVGNPFMAHMDMKKFFDGNPSLPKKFWIMSGDKEIAVSIDNDGTFTVANGTADEVTRIAPMQGFFVEAGTAVKELTVNFTPDMMWVPNVPDADEDYKPGHLLKAPRPETLADGEDIIRMSTEESTAIIRLSGSADKGYASSEDVEMIDDSNQRSIRRIYTVAGTMASAINQTPDADGVEVGLMAPADSVTVVTFSGVALEDYLLYDTATGEMTQLYDGFELEMTGSVSGRYFLTAGIDTAEIEDGTIRIIPAQHEVVVTAPAVCGEMTVRVFDTLGREVAKAEGMEGEVRIALDPGIYAVEAVGSEAGRKSAKLQIR